MEDDDSPTSKCDASDGHEVNDTKSLQITAATSIQSSQFIQNAANKTLASLKCLPSNPEDDEIGDGLRTTTASINATTDNSQDFSKAPICVDQIQSGTALYTTEGGKVVERRRRKLPEIPKNKRCKPKTKTKILFHLTISVNLFLMHFH